MPRVGFRELDSREPVSAARNRCVRRPAGRAGGGAGSRGPVPSRRCAPVAAADQAGLARDRAVRVGEADADRAAHVGPVGAFVELEQQHQRMAGAARRAQAAWQTDAAASGVTAGRRPARLRSRAMVPRRKARSAPASGARRAARWPPVTVSAMASVKPLSQQLAQDDAFDGLLILGDDEVAEPLAHLGLGRLEQGGQRRVVVGAQRELGLELRIVRLEAELDAAFVLEAPRCRPASGRRAIRRCRTCGSASAASRPGGRSIARMRGITCSSIMRRISRGTPGVKKKRPCRW